MTGLKEVIVTVRISQKTLDELWDKRLSKKESCSSLLRRAITHFINTIDEYNLKLNTKKLNPSGLNIYPSDLKYPSVTKSSFESINLSNGE